MESGRRRCRPCIGVDRCPPTSAPTQINSEHGSKALFMQQVSKCIFTNCPDDLINLNKAQETAGFKSNGAKEKRGVTARHTYVVSFVNQKRVLPSYSYLLNSTCLRRKRRGSAFNWQLIGRGVQRKRRIVRLMLRY